MPRKLLLPALLAALVAAPPAASAATTIGQHPDGVLAGQELTCAAGCTLVQARLSAVDQRVPAEPSVVTDWQIRGDDGSARLRRLTVNGDGTVTAREASPAVGLTGANVAGAGGLRLEGGELLAVELSPGASIGAVESFFDSDVLLGWSPALAEGTARDADTAEQGYLAYQATVEPDRDRDGLGDESQDGCVLCERPPGGDGGPAPQPQPETRGTPSPSPSPSPSPERGGGSGPIVPEDPYAEIRKRGPKVTVGRSVSRKGRTVQVALTNPYDFPLTGTVRVLRGRRTAGSAKVKLAAGATATVGVRTKGVTARTRKLSVAAALRGPVGKAATTKAAVTLAKRASGGGKSGGGGKAPAGGGGDGADGGGIDGEYRGEGAGADWILVIRGGVVTSFNGTMGLTCAKSKAASNHAFSMIGDDPDPTVGPDGSFAWEATGGYGFTKLKFSGKVAGGRITGNASVEYRPPVNGADPITGMPRMEFDACFGGRDFTLTR